MPGRLRSDGDDASHDRRKLVENCCDGVVVGVYTSTSSSFVPGSAPNAPTMSVAKARLSIMTSTFGNSLYLSDAQA